MHKIHIMVLLLGLTGCADKLAAVNGQINQHVYSKQYTCQNYVEDKYKELVKQGYSDQDMKFVITDYKGEPHVVLNVRGWILDNLKNKPYLASKRLQDGLSYHYWQYYRTHMHFKN